MALLYNKRLIPYADVWDYHKNVDVGSIQKLIWLDTIADVKMMRDEAEADDARQKLEIDLYVFKEARTQTARRLEAFEATGGFEQGKRQIRASAERHLADTGASCGPNPFHVNPVMAHPRPGTFGRPCLTHGAVLCAG